MLHLVGVRQNYSFTNWVHPFRNELHTGHTTYLYTNVRAQTVRLRHLREREPHAPLGQGAVGQAKMIVDIF